MGSWESEDASNEMLFGWISDQVTKETPWETDYIHMTDKEKDVIDKTVLRIMETNRRIETQLLFLGKDDEGVLDPLKY